MLHHTKTFTQLYDSNFVSTVWGRPFPVPAWLCSMGKASSKTCSDEFGVEEFRWSAQNADLNPTELNELECQVRVKLSHLTSVPDLTNAFLTR